MNFIPQTFFICYKSLSSSGKGKYLFKSEIFYLQQTYLHIYKVNQLKIKANFIIYILGCNSKSFYKNDANTVLHFVQYLGYDNGYL